MTSGDLAALELDHDAHAVAVGLVAQVGDALDLLLAHQLGDALDQPRLVDLVGDLGDDDRLRARRVAGSRSRRAARIWMMPRPVA